MRVITGTARGRVLKELEGLETRPTTGKVKESLFSIIQFDIEGRRVLDLFAGTGAISFEFLSRECHSVTAVEKAATQYNFIKKVAQQLNITNMKLIKGDVAKFLSTCDTPFDIVFADPPYNLPDFDTIPGMILGSGAVASGTVVVVEHSKAYDFSSLPGFIDHRVYGSVNFSIFRVGDYTD